MNDYRLDEEITTTDWPLPSPLPLFESEAANESRKPSLWARFVSWLDAAVFGEYD